MKITTKKTGNGRYLLTVGGVSFDLRKGDYMWEGNELTESGAQFYNGFEAIAKTKKEAIQQCVDYMSK